MNHTVSTDAMQGTHESLRGNSRALSTVTAIIDGTGSIGVYVQDADVLQLHGYYHKT